ncbi:restriction endonuclease subunit S [Actinomadura rugatobispora]|uniref:Restriction endonuclease subunit S n=1 Tax=Actinomadura rugatobispora TaxID=1994 RepID=A0ABW1A0Y6_9ACTN|nr:hypothetical protein GCM10010200_042760 [Actinomadura rugatobispora]
MLTFPAGTSAPLVRLGYLARVQSGITVDASRQHTEDKVTLPYLRVANVQAGRLALDSVTEITVSRTTAATATLLPGDVLMTEGGDLDKLGRGTVWRSEIPVCLHQNHVFAVRPNPRLDPDYLAYLTQSAYARHYFESTGTKTTNLASTSSSKIRDFKIPLWPLEKQRRITDFLDAETARIDQVMSVSRRTIDLLEERRWASIYNGVTGQNTSLPKSPRSLGWVDCLPDNWPIVKLNQVAKLGSGHTPSRTRPEYWENCNIPWISLFDVGSMRNPRQEYLHETKQQISQLGIDNSSACIHPAGTVVLSRTASVGFSTIMAKEMAVSQHFVTWTCGSRLAPAYLLYLLRSMRQYFESVQVGTTNVTVFMPDLYSIRVPIPSIHQQTEIVQKIRATSGRINQAVDNLSRQVELLAERRRALITAAVTGQFDVSTASGRGVTE